MLEHSRKDLELIELGLIELPPCDLWGLKLTSDQMETVNEERFRWKCISLSWGARIREEEDPLELMYQRGAISKWGKTLFQLETDYFWKLWLITQAVWTDIKAAVIKIPVSPSIETPGQLFRLALQMTSMRPVMLTMETYREISYQKRQKIAKLIPKAMTGNLHPAKKRELDYLMKEQYTISVPKLEAWCSELLDYILCIAYEKAKRDIRLRSLADDLKRSTSVCWEHISKKPNSDTKSSKRQRSHAFHKGEKLYATRGGAYKKTS